MGGRKLSFAFCDVLEWSVLDWGIIASGAIFYPVAYLTLFHLVSGQFTEELIEAIEEERAEVLSLLK